MTGAEEKVHCFVISGVILSTDNDWWSSIEVWMDLKHPSSKDCQWTINWVFSLNSKVQKCVHENLMREVITPPRAPFGNIQCTRFRLCCVLSGSRKNNKLYKRVKSADSSNQFRFHFLEEFSQISDMGYGYLQQ